jgi:hypothetical protein
MTWEEPFIAGQMPMADRSESWLENTDPIDEEKWRTMRQHL